MFERQALSSVVLIPLLLAAGCSEGDAETPYVGTYEVRSHTENVMGCEGAGEAVEGDVLFFSLEDESFFGVSLLTWHDCESASSCNEEGALDRSFTKEGSEWTSKVIFASGDVDCSLGLTEGTITETDAGIRLEFRSYEGVLTVASEEACETDVAEQRRDELDCTGIEVLEATLL
ncbi:MAG: hypothetical protein ACRBN8_01240 [Nannocystales bacterium]